MNTLDKIKDTLRHIDMGSNLREIKPYNYAIISAIVNKSGKPAREWRPSDMELAIAKYRQEHDNKPMPVYTEAMAISYLKSRGYKIYKLQEVAV